MLTPITINYQVFLYCTFFRDIKERSTVGDEQLIQNYRYKYQFGLCKSHSTSHAIITLIDSRQREICCWPIFGYMESI